MNKKELVDVMIGKGLFATKKHAEEVVNEIIEEFSNALSLGGTVELFGFGKFDVVERGSREGRNPKTGEPMSIPACKAVRFKTAKALKDKVNK